MPNITSGRAGKQISEVLGLKELKAKVKNLSGAMVSNEAQGIVGSAARYTSAEIRHSAEGVGLPRDAQKDIFSYSKPQMKPSGAAAKVSALAGVRKRGRNAQNPTAKGYRTWNPKGGYTRARVTGPKYQPKVVLGRKLAPGGKIGENLATMWELGTSHPWMPARPFFRPAIQRAQARVMTMLKDGYSQLIQKYAKANP